MQMSSHDEQRARFKGDMRPINIALIAIALLAIAVGLRAAEPNVDPRLQTMSDIAHIDCGYFVFEGEGHEILMGGWAADIERVSMIVARAIRHDVKIPRECLTLLEEQNDTLMCHVVEVEESLGSISIWVDSDIMDLVIADELREIVNDGRSNTSHGGWDIYTIPPD